ncbi:MAG: S1 RNA-binding domain-containing protein [Chloroflexi bacterium]|nr:S1 RNA-binding domain-containing protein [Chloroflexota bacterium]
MKQLSVGQHIEAVVERILPFGVFVLLEDGKHAYIRRRELDLDADVDPRLVLKEGDRIQAVVLRMGELERYTELSRRVTLQDPWTEFLSQYGVGNIVTGIVHTLHPHGVFVRVRPGIDGFVPLEEMTTISVSKPEDVLWVGDETEAMIVRIEQQKKHITLSIKARMKQYDQALDVAEKLSNRVNNDLQLDEIINTKPNLEVSTFEKVGPILIAEDDKYVRESLSSWLRQKGFVVHEAETALQAIELQPLSPKIYFIDLNLIGEDGLELVRHLKRDNANACICIMSSPEMLAERATEIEDVDVFDVFPKPLDVEEIEQFLARVARNELIPYWRVNRISFESNMLSVAFSNFEKSHITQLKDAMTDIASVVKAQTGILFQLEQDTQTISIATQSGAEALNISALYGLKVSPVKDVIQDGVTVFEKRISEKALARFEKLLDLLPFESCIGVPIKVHGEIRHAAFFFHPGADAFSNYRLRDIQAGALLLSEILSEEVIQERLLKLNPMLLSGELAASFGHDVFNKITALELEARNLADSNLNTSSTRSPRILELVLDLKNTVHAFQQMLRVNEKMEFVDVNNAIERAAVLLRDLTRKERVKVVKNLTPELPNVIGNQTFLQQAFLNIMLNAIQQMALKADRYKWNNQPVLEIGSILSLSTSMLEIRFKDNGPGIHKVQFTKLFSPGFSTRGGSGLGLYIARSFVEAIGGTLQVEESYVPLGTTFLVRVPVAIPEIKK